MKTITEKAVEILKKDPNYSYMSKFDLIFLVEGTTFGACLKFKVALKDFINVVSKSFPSVFKKTGKIKQ